MERKETINSIEITRNVSTTNEMRLISADFTVKANVESSDGSVNNITDGLVSETTSGTYRASFRSYGQGSFTLEFPYSETRTREDRSEIYAAVEDFIEAASAKVATAAQTSGSAGM